MSYSLFVLSIFYFHSSDILSFSAQTLHNATIVFIREVFESSLNQFYNASSIFLSKVVHEYFGWYNPTRYVADPRFLHLKQMVLFPKTTLSIPPMKNRSSERACFKNQSSERVRFKIRSTGMYKKSSLPFFPINTFIWSIFHWGLRRNIRQVIFPCPVTEFIWIERNWSFCLMCFYSTFRRQVERSIERKALNLIKQSSCFISITPRPIGHWLWGDLGDIRAEQ